MAKFVRAVFFIGLAGFGSIGWGGETVADDVFDQLQGNSAPQKNKFQTVLKLAVDSPTVSFEEAEGVYVGRCFDLLHPDQAFASALVILERASKDGPLFKSEKFLIEAGARNQPADYFDNQGRESLISDLMTLKKQFHQLVTDPLSVHVSGEATLRFSRSGDYLLSVGSPLHDIWVDTAFPPIHVKAGQDWMACYYFVRK